MTNDDKKKYDAGFETARHDIARKGVHYAQRVPQSQDHPQWVMGYLVACAAARDGYLR